MPDEGDTRFPVWRENWPTLMMFQRLANQWHMVDSDGDLVRTGIRRDAIEFELRYANGLARRRWNARIDELVAMENAAIAAMNEQRKKRNKARLDQLARER